MEAPSIPPPKGSGALPGAALLAQRLDEILDGLLKVIAAHFRVLAEFILPAWGRVSRARQRLARLLARLAAGTYPGPRRPDARKRQGGPPAPYAPQSKLWLVRKIGYQAAGRGSQLQFLLDDPQTRALLDAAPPHAVAAIARALRPICRTLGVDLPPELQPPPKAPPPPQPLSPQPLSPQPLSPKPRPTKAPRPKLPPLLPLYPQRRPRDLPFINFAKKPSPDALPTHP